MKAFDKIPKELTVSYDDGSKKTVSLTYDVFLKEAQDRHSDWSSGRSSGKVAAYQALSQHIAKCKEFNLPMTVESITEWLDKRIEKELLCQQGHLQK